MIILTVELYDRFHQHDIADDHLITFDTTKCVEQLSDF